MVVKIARALHEKLEELELNVFVKTSGATGIHLYLPVEPVYTYEQLRTFAEIVARMVTAEHPSLVTNERIVAKRPAGRVLIDVQQNAQGRPLAAAYVVRAFPESAGFHSATTQRTAQQPQARKIEYQVANRTPGRKG